MTEDIHKREEQKELFQLRFYACTTGGSMTFLVKVNRRQCRVQSMPFLGKADTEETHQEKILGAVSAAHFDYCTRYKTVITGWAFHIEPE